MPEFNIGDKVFHAKFGIGEVCSELRIEDHLEVLDVTFDGGVKVLALQYAKLQHIGQDHSNILTQQYQQWLKGRFLLTRFNPAHVFAGHWQPFFDHLEPYDELSMAALLKRYLPTAKVYAGKKPMDVVIESLVNCSPISYQLHSPNATMGLSVVLDPKPEGNQVRTITPFFAEGALATLRLLHVHVWENGLEAHIEADWFGLEICFYDTRFIHKRSYYAADMVYEFALTGFAYTARLADENFMFEDQGELIDGMIQEGIVQHASEVDTSQCVTFLPMAGRGRDDYQFRGRIKALQPFNDFLGQTGWVATVTVMHTLLEDEDQDLNIVITRKAWKGEMPPIFDGFIEGELWLQGCL